MFIERQRDDLRALTVGGRWLVTMPASALDMTPRPATAAIPRDR